MTDQSGQQVTFNGTPTGTPMMGGYQYNGYTPQPKINNYLSEDEIKALQQNTNMFTLNLTEEEMLRARCNHRSIDGMSDTLVYDQNTGIARCTICGYEFKPIEPNSTYENIKDSTDNIILHMTPIAKMFINNIQDTKDQFNYLSDAHIYILDYCIQNRYKKNLLNISGEIQDRRLHRLHILIAEQ